MELSLGWRTDLHVRRLGGSEVTEHPDHLVVRTPANPSFWWGNFVMVTDPAVADDPEHWLALFEREFPDAAHRAIGLPAAPADPAAWLALRLFVEPAEVLVSQGPLPDAPLADGYDVRVLSSAEDWEQSTRMRQLAFPEQDDHEARTTESRIRTRDAITWFGAFRVGVLAAELGIVDCGDGIARYQSVLTHPDHRRRGLTRHLLGVAGQHAVAGGATTLVIIADTGSDAERLYRASGFGHDSTVHQVSRVPQPDDA